jgi:hypothetical protein
MCWRRWRGLKASKGLSTALPIFGTSSPKEREEEKKSGLNYSNRIFYFDYILSSGPISYFEIT